MLSLLAGRLAMGGASSRARSSSAAPRSPPLRKTARREAMRWAARFALTDALIATIDLEAASAASAGAEPAGEDAGPAAIFCALTHAGDARRGSGGTMTPSATLEATLSMAGGRRLLGPGRGRLPGALSRPARRPAGRGAGELDAGVERA